MNQGFVTEVFASFQGEGAHVGRRHLFVRLGGCNIRCRYCDTPEGLTRSPSFRIVRRDRAEALRENPVSAGDLVPLLDSMCESEGPVDAVALTGGEPLVQSGFIAEVLRAANFRVPVLLETNGTLPGRLAEVLQWVDIVSMDLKLPSNTGEGDLWEAHHRFLGLAQGREVYVKILVDQSTDLGDLERAVALVASYGSQLPVFLQPITDARGLPSIQSDRLAELYDAARQHLDSVRVLPQIHKFLGVR